METGIEPIGHVVGSRAQRRDDRWDDEVSVIRLAERFGREATVGLSDFSHIEVVFRFHEVSDDEVTFDARHPRNNEAWPKVGIFAQRASKRPNRIGVTICRLVQVDGTHLHVRGLDAIDGTPVLDVKPVMAEFLPRGDVRQPDWSHELMRGYWSVD